MTGFGHFMRRLAQPGLVRLSASLKETPRPSWLAWAGSVCFEHRGRHVGLPRLGSFQRPVREQDAWDAGWVKDMVPAPELRLSSKMPCGAPPSAVCHEAQQALTVPPRPTSVEAHVGGPLIAISRDPMRKRLTWPAARDTILRSSSEGRSGRRVVQLYTGAEREGIRAARRQFESGDRSHPPCRGHPAGRAAMDEPEPSPGASGRPAWVCHVVGAAGLLLVAAVVTLIPLLFSRSTIEAGRVKLMVVEILTLALAVVWLVGRLEGCGGGSVAWRSPWTLPVLSLMAANLASLFFSRFPDASVREVWRVGIYLMLFLCVQDILRRPWQRWVIVVAILAAASGVAGYGVLQKMGADPVRWSADPGHRIFSTVGNPNMLAGYLTMTAALACACFIATKRWWLRAPLLVLLGALLCCLFWTQTRAAWFGFLAGIGLFGVMLWRGGHLDVLRRHKQLTLIGAGVAAVLLLNVGVYLYKPVAERFATAGTGMRVRHTMWQGAWGMFRERPVLGYGPGTFQVGFPKYRPPNFREPERRISYNTLHAHNELLETGAELGVVGLACFVWLLAAVFWETWCAVGRREGGPDGLLMAGIGAAVAALMVQNLSCVAYRWIVCPTTFWVMLGMGGSILAKARAGRAREAEEARSVPAMSWPHRLAVYAVAAGLAGMLAVAVSVRTYRSQQLLRTASDMADRGVWSEAIDAFRESIALDPLEYRSHYKLAYCYCEAGDYGRALETYHELQRRAPDFAQIHYNLGFVHSCLQQWDKAAEEFLIASRAGVMPEDVNYGPIIERLQAKLADKEKTLAVLRQIAESNPRDKLAQNRLGIFHYNDGKLDEAASCYGRALAVDPAYVAALNNLAGVLYRKKDYRGAIETCQRVLTIDPNAIKPRVNLGRAYYLAGDRARATQEWQNALKVDPRNGEALACLKSFGQEGKPPLPQGGGQAPAPGK